MDFDINKTIESLESDYWPSVSEDEESHLVYTCNQLRKKPLKDFSIEDLRIMIGQNIGLEYLIPLALDQLKINILSEGDFYEGDLLCNVLSSDPKYWKLHRVAISKMLEILREGQSKVDTHDTTKEIRKQISEYSAKFRADYEVRK